MANRNAMYSGRSQDSRIGPPGTYWTGNSYERYQPQSYRNPRGGSGGYSFSGAGGVKGGGGGSATGAGASHTSSIPIPFSEQAINEEGNAQRSAMAQALQNPNGAAQRQLSRMGSSYGSNSPLLQAMNVGLTQNSIGQGAEAARQARNQMTMQNQTSGYIPRSNESLQLMGLNMQQHQADLDRQLRQQLANQQMAAGMMSSLMSMYS